MADNSAKIVITAVDNTKAGIDSAKRGVQSLSGAISSIPGFGGVAASLAAFAGLGAMQALVGDTISAAAAMDDLAEKTGASVENLSGLAKVAKISGVEIGLVETGLIKLSKALAGADDESKGAGHALAAIGLKAEKLREQDPAETLKEVADALAEYADGAGKTALAQDLFGKSGAQLLPLLKDLAEEERLQGKLTSEQAAAAEALEKAWNRTNAEGAAWAKTIVISMIPALASLLDYLNMTKIGLQEVGVGLMTIVKAIPSYIEQASVSLYSGGNAEKLQAVVDDRQRMFGEQRQKLIDLQGSYKPLRPSVDDILAGNVTPKKRLQYQSRVPSAPRAGRASAGGASAGGARARQIGGVNDYDAILAERIARAIEQTDVVKAQQLADELAKLDQIAAAGLDPAIVKAVRDDLTGATKTAADELKRLNDLLGATPTAQLEKLRDDMRFLTAALEEGRIAEEQYLEATTARIDVQKESVKNTLSDLDQFAIQAAKNTQDAFADFLFDPFKEGVEGMLQGFGTAIRRMIANAVAADLGKRLFGDIGAGNGIGGLLGEGLKFFAAELPSFAVGTPYVPRDMIAQLHRGERVVPAAQNAGSGASGHTVIVNQYLSGGAGAADVRRSGGELGRGVLTAISGAGRFR